MECEFACEQLGAWIDRQLSPEQAAALEAHLANCAECRSAAESLRAQDADLAQAFQPARAAARRVAAAVIGRLNDDEPVRRPPAAVDENTVAENTVAEETGHEDMVDDNSTAEETTVPEHSVPESAAALRLRRRRSYFSHVLAAAAGFILAVVLFQQWNRSATTSLPNNLAPPMAMPEWVEPPVAELVVATGEVQVRSAGESDWETPARLDYLSCASDDVVRTGPNVRCEWKIAGGSVVRLDGDTQVRFASGGMVEIQRGQIACSSPENASLTVIVPERAASAKGALPSEFTCRPQSSALAAVEPDGDVQVTSSAGDIALQTPAGATPLKRGESVRLVDGQIVPVRATDPLLAAGWTAALLVRKGHDDPELGGRVDELLARMGQSKVSLLYEEEIRALGEYAVLPLLKYVESPLSQNERARRQEAMRLAADLAPTWAVTDLVRLLADADPDTRYLAAQALRRLTGSDQGRPPDEWREDLKKCEPTIELWRKWLQQEPNRFPPRKPDRQT